MSGLSKVMRKNQMKCHCGEVEEVITHLERCEFFWLLSHQMNVKALGTMPVLSLGVVFKFLSCFVPLLCTHIFEEPWWIFLHHVLSPLGQIIFLGSFSGKILPSALGGLHINCFCLIECMTASLVDLI